MCNPLSAPLRRRLSALLLLLALAGVAAPAQAASGWAQEWFDNATYASPGSFNDQTRGYLTAGGINGRFNVHNDYLTSLSLPKIKAGCGGIDMFLGGLSFLDPDYLVQKLEYILQAAPAVAFQYLLETLDEKMGNIISKMEAATNYLNSIQVNDCRLADRSVRIAKGEDGLSGILEEMTGYKSVKEGLKRSFDDSRKAIEANKNNPTEDLKQFLSNCPPEVTEIFKSGSLLANAASRVGASAYAGVMRGRVGDVWMQWNATDKVPSFTPVAACPTQDNEGFDDILDGTTQVRPAGVDAKGNPPACVADDPGRGSLAIVREKLESIADKIRGKAALSNDEMNFVANVRTLPVYQMLAWGVREKVEASVIGDVDELVAITLAYQMLNDLARSLDYTIGSAARSAKAAGSADPALKDICTIKVVAGGLIPLEDLRDEIFRQRAQVRQAYITALNGANLSASYANLVRARDKDARDRTATQSTRN